MNAKETKAVFSAIVNSVKGMNPTRRTDGEETGKGYSEYTSFQFGANGDGYLALNGDDDNKYCVKVEVFRVSNDKLKAKAEAKAERDRKRTERANKAKEKVSDTDALEQLEALTAKLKGDGVNLADLSAIIGGVNA